MEKTFWITMEDDVAIYIKKWYTSSKEPKAIVQLAHGMVEHINRYNEFAQFLVEQGFFVYGNDHRGHGNTGERQGLLGYFSEEDGFAKTANDLHVITNRIKQHYPNTPIILFGHSMGSFLTRNYLQQYSMEVNGAILSGTGYFPSLTSQVGKMIAGWMPPKKESKLMNSIAFGNYNRKIDKSTGFDWLTRDQSVVANYIEDPHSGFVPTARFFYDLMTGLIRMNNTKLNQNIRKDLPLFFISGDADPVGNYAKGVWKTAHQYEKLGLENITTMLFSDGRHELLNEVNKEEVYAAIVKWIHHCL